MEIYDKNKFKNETNFYLSEQEKIDIAIENDLPIHFFLNNNSSIVGYVKGYNDKEIVIAKIIFAHDGKDEFDIQVDLIDKINIKKSSITTYVIVTPNMAKDIILNKKNVKGYNEKNQRY